MDEAIRQFLADVRDYESKREMAEFTERAFCNKHDPKAPFSYSEEIINDDARNLLDRGSEKFRAQWKLLESGKALATQAAATAVATTLWEFIYFMELPHADVPKALAMWPALFAELNVMLSKSPNKAAATNGWYGRPVAQFITANANDDEANMKQFVREWNRTTDGKQLLYGTFRARVSEARKQRTLLGVHKESSKKASVKKRVAS